MVSLLLEAGADVNAADVSGTPPLAYALRIPSQGLISFLLEQGASGDISIRDGEPALVHAVRARDIRLADSLLRAGAKVDARAADGWIGLPLAISHEDQPMAVTLLSAKANPDLKTPSGDAPDHGGARDQCLLVSLLLRHKANPSAPIRAVKRRSMRLSRAVTTPWSECSTRPERIQETEAPRDRDRPRRQPAGFTILEHANPDRAMPA